MLAQPKIQPQHTTATAPAELRRWYMVVDGNQHRPDLCAPQPGFEKPFMISEALIPQVRTIACLIATERLNFDGSQTPDAITTEADWFAARILVLGVKVFHLDVSLIPMLKTANQRAQAFARKHKLSFYPAQMRMSLHAARPQHMLVMETGDNGHNDAGLVLNSMNMRCQLVGQHPLLRI